MLKVREMKDWTVDLNVNWNVSLVLNDTVWHSVSPPKTHETLKNLHVQNEHVTAHNTSTLWPSAHTLQHPIIPDMGLTIFNVLTACSTDLINHALWDQ